MLGQQIQRLTEELREIDAALRKSKKKKTHAGKVEHRIGCWQGRNPAAYRLLDVMVLKDEKQQAIGMQLICPLEKRLFAAYKLHGNRSHKTVESVHASSLGESCVPDCKKRH